MAARVILDVRENYRVALKPIEGAMHLPLGLLLAAPEKVPMAARLVVVSDRDEDSRFATRYLMERGYDATPGAL